VAADTWTLKKADEKRLAAFEMRCYRRLLRIRWQYFQTNESIRRQRSRQHTIVDRVRRRKLELFGHTCRMPENRMLESVVWGGGRSQLTKEVLGRRHTEVVRHDTTTGVTSCTGSCDVEESHSWPLRFLNHGTRRRRTSYGSPEPNSAMLTQ